MGLVVAMVIVVTALAAVSEIVLPLTFAAVIAIVLQAPGREPGPPPVRARPGRRSGRARPARPDGLVVVATVRGVIAQTDQISAAVDAALDNLTDQSDALIMYYLLKDGTRLRRSVVAQVDPRLRDELSDFLGDAIRILRDYGRGRTVLSVIVSVVIGLAALLLGLPLVLSSIIGWCNFVGGYTLHRAFLGGGLAVIVALGEGGSPRRRSCSWPCSRQLLLENFVEPKVMGRASTSTRWWCWS